MDDLVRATLVALTAVVVFVQLIQGAPAVIDLSQQKGRFQGDVTNRKITRTSNVARNAVKFDSSKWPNGRVPYEIRPNFGIRERQVILNAMNRLEKTTCVRFVKRTNERDYIYINNTNDGCYSAIGKEGGAQEVSLQDNSDSTCVEHSTVIHELLHVLGLDHEQARYDRDQFVTINFQNIEEGYDDQFQIFSALFSTFHGTPYDYTSVMHYTAYAFGKSPNLVTIMPKDVSKLSVIGKAADASYYDLLKINRMYNCGIDNPVVVNPNTNSGSCVDKQPQSTCNAYLSFCNSWPTLRTECPKTCGFCTIVANQQISENCSDKTESATCKIYADLKYCDTWDVLKTECRKTCNFCNVSK